MDSGSGGGGGGTDTDREHNNTTIEDSVSERIEGVSERLDGAGSSENHELGKFELSRSTSGMIGLLLAAFEKVLM